MCICCSKYWNQPWRKANIPIYYFIKTFFPEHLTVPTALQAQSFTSEPEQLFPLCFHRLMLFESLWTLTILLASRCPYVSLKLCLMALLPIKSPWNGAGTRHSQHQDRHWCSLSTAGCLLYPPIHDQEVPAHSWNQSLTFCTIPCSSRLFDFIPHPSNFKLIIAAQPFQFFQYFEKTYLNPSIISGWLNYLWLWIFGTLLTDTLKPEKERQDMQALIEIIIL